MKNHELLKKYSLDEDSMKEFQSKIKKTSKACSDALGWGLNSGWNDINQNSYNEEYVLDLVLNGANLNFEYKAMFPLRLAIERNFFEVFLILIRAGADINYKSSDGWTSAILCAFKGNNEMLEILLAMGVDIYEKYGDTEKTIFDMAKESPWSNSKCIDLIEKEMIDFNDQIVLSGGNQKSKK